MSVYDELYERVPDVDAVRIIIEYCNGRLTNRGEIIIQDDCEACEGDGEGREHICDECTSAEESMDCDECYAPDECEECDGTGTVETNW